MFSFEEMAVNQIAAIPTALVETGVAVERYGDLGQLWLDGMWRGDPLADAVVAKGATLVRKALLDGIGSIESAPDALVSLFAELDTPPGWLDLDRCDRAAEHLVRQHREYGLVLGAASLVAGAQNTIAGKPLTFTGRYASNAALRSIEVGSWLLAVTTPGGMERYGLGFQKTVRVRMIHAHVRAHLSGHEDWDAAAWGVPIPQPYMAFTLAEFCSIALRAMGQLGVRFTDSEVEDILHLWRYVGHVVGVEENLLPVILDGYERIESLYALTGPGADDGDRAFVAALTDFQSAELSRVLPTGWSRRIVRGLQRSFVGDAIADDLAIPDSWCKHLPRMIAPVTSTGYAVHDKLVPGGKARRTARAFEVRARELERLRREHSIMHELVDES